MTAPRFVLAAKNKGGVGATFVSRAFLEFADAGQRRWRVFDGQAPGGSLKRFYKDAEIVNFAVTAGRMRVIDGLGAQTTFLDAPAGLLSETLQLLHDVGYMAEAARGQQDFAVLHVVGPNVDSMLEAAEIAARMAEGGKHYLVRNCANDEQFTWSDGAYKQMLAAVDPAAVVDVGHLDPMAREAVDGSGMSFSEFIADERQSALQRRLVRKWRDDTFATFEKAGFRSLA
jgi:hypothetical protein